MIPRRTGGPHAHEFACHAIGPHYALQVAVLCHNQIEIGAPRTLDTLLDAIDDLLFPIRGEPAGVVVSQSAGLSAGALGCILVARSTDHVRALERKLLGRLRAKRVAGSCLTDSGSG